MKIDYRSYARQAMKRAQQELQAGDDVCLRPAALQLGIKWAMNGAEAM